MKTFEVTVKYRVVLSDEDEKDFEEECKGIRCEEQDYFACRIMGDSTFDTGYPDVYVTGVDWEEIPTKQNN